MFKIPGRVGEKSHDPPHGKLSQFMKTKNNYRPESLPTFKDVVSAVKEADSLDPSHSVRDCVLSEYRKRGGRPDQWNDRTAARMIDSIVYCEDRIELLPDSKNRKEARLTLQRIRRILEWWCWS